MIWQDSAANQKIRAEFVAREVMANITDFGEHLFNEFLGHPYAAPTDFENHEFYMCPFCCVKFTRTEAKYKDGNGKTLFYRCPHCHGDMDELPDVEYADYAEIYIVSEFLGRNLMLRGECVLPRSLGWIWLRQGSGQAISMDSVISDICEDLNLLTGGDEP